MDRLEQGRAPLPGGADNARVLELLAHWDELSTGDLEALAQNPDAGRRLRLLMEVQDWLTSDLPDVRCPEPDALYDFARGPGYVTLTANHRRSIADHLEHCQSCAASVASLEAAPPLPLDLSPPEEADVRPPARLARWIPLVAAAAVLVIGLNLMDGPETVDAVLLPTSPLLRGLSEEALLFPRGRVLPPDSLAEGGFADRPHFELAAQPRASSYRVLLFRNSGGAFEAGEQVLALAGNGPDLHSEVPLVVGHYTWEAWAVVDGLDRALGERDFQVVDEPALRVELLDLRPAPRVRCLHEAGYLVDARWVARRLPASSERDAYLGVTPER